METILFLHGWGGDENSFAHILPALKKFYRCLVIKMPMFQKDDIYPEDAWLMTDYADYVLDFIDSNKVDKCHVIAHSFGARIFTICFDKRPELFDKAVLTGAAGLLPRKRFLLWVRIRLYKIKRKLFKRSKQKGSHDYMALNNAGKKTFQHVIRTDLAPLVKNIKTPTLLIHGTLDSAVPLYMAKRWTRICQSARMITYIGIGHFCFIEKPTQFVADTIHFLQGE